MDLIIVLYIGLAYWLYRYFAKGDRGSKEPISALRLAGLLGVFGAFTAGTINSLVLPENLLGYLEGAAVTPSYEEIIRGSLLVGLVEETIKFLPLALVIYRQKYFNETTDGIIYFGLAGMWFGTIESIMYAATFGEHVGFLRLIVAPFLHAGFSAIAGWGLATHKVRNASIFLPLFWLTVAILVHGIYDFGLFSREPVYMLGSLLIAIMVNLGLFFLFKHAKKQDEALGLSAVGVNVFCRQCGRQNTAQTMFCIYCGKKT